MMSKFTYVKPTICIDEVKFCKDGKFFYAKYKDSGFFIIAKYNFDEILYSLEKQGFDIINKDGSLYDIKMGA